MLHWSPDKGQSDILSVAHALLLGQIHTNFSSFLRSHVTFKGFRKGVTHASSLRLSLDKAPLSGVNANEQGLNHAI